MFSQESEPDLSDSEMERLDSVLAAACKIAQSNKLDKKEREQQVRNFQMRCLELVDIMATSETIPTHLLQVPVLTQSAKLGYFFMNHACTSTSAFSHQDTLEPLILFMDRNQKHENKLELKNRAQRVFKNVCKVKPVCGHSPSSIYVV